MLTNLEQCIHWVKEREAVRVRKEHGDPQPWTTDEHLATWRFCNVRREDDRVTRWIDKHIRRPYADHEDLWFMLCASRVLNWPASLNMLIGDPEAPTAQRVYPGAWPSHDGFSPKKMGVALEDMASSGMKVFTGAYMITAPPTKGAKKTTFVADKTLGNLWTDRHGFREHFARNPTMRSTHARLSRYDGWGPFMAYQAIIDMRHTRLLENAPDKNTWAAAGPGTLRGLNRVANRPYTSALSQAQALSELVALRPVISAATGMGFELYEVTGIMCETDKYLRLVNKEGEPRARYVPGRGA